MKEPLNTLVYKRTHRGDPNKSGMFGIHDCMGRVRRWAFDAVVGVGGNSPDRGHEDIARKINWVGVSPYTAGKGSRGPLVKFERFVLLEEDGPSFKNFAPNLFRYMFEDKHVRLVMSQNLASDIMRREVEDILNWAIKNDRPRKSVSRLVSPGTTDAVCKKRVPTRRRC